MSLIFSGNRSHEALVTYPVLVCPLVSPSYEQDRVTDVALIAELNTAALWQRKACAAEGLTLAISGSRPRDYQHRRILSRVRCIALLGREVFQLHIRQALPEYFRRIMRAQCLDDCRQRISVDARQICLTRHCDWKG